MHTADLAPIIQRVLDAHDAEHEFTADPHRGEESGSDRMPETTARDWICAEAGVDPKTLYMILTGRQKWTSLDRAESLLIAVGREYALYNGEVRVVPNPFWSTEKWASYMAERGCEPDEVLG